MERQCADSDGELQAATAAAGELQATNSDATMWARQIAEAKGKLQAATAAAGEHPAASSEAAMAKLRHVRAAAKAKLRHVEAAAMAKLRRSLSMAVAAATGIEVIVALAEANLYSCTSGLQPVSRHSLGPRQSTRVQ